MSENKVDNRLANVANWAIWAKLFNTIYCDKESHYIECVEPFLITFSILEI